MSRLSITLPLPSRLRLRPSQPRELPDIDSISVYDENNDYFYSPPASDCSPPPSPISPTSSISGLSLWSGWTTSSSARQSDCSVPRSLRRRYTPRNESLRQLRTRDSEARLQQVYERQTLEYLSRLAPMPLTRKNRVNPSRRVLPAIPDDSDSEAEEEKKSSCVQSPFARGIEIWRQTVREEFEE